MVDSRISISCPKKLVSHFIGLKFDFFFNLTI